MQIIKCNCGYYKQLDDELCPKCGADYSLGAEYEVLEDQEKAYMRWVNLGEKGFNDYMKSASAPHFMLCPECKFKMLVTETECPKCGLKVRYKGPYKTPLITKLALGASWLQILLIGIPLIFFILVYIFMLILR